MGCRKGIRGFCAAGFVPAAPQKTFPWGSETKTGNQFPEDILTERKTDRTKARVKCTGFFFFKLNKLYTRDIYKLFNGGEASSGKDEAAAIGRRLTITDGFLF